MQMFICCFVLFHYDLANTRYVNVSSTKRYYFALRRGYFAYRQKYFCVYAQGILRVRKSEIATYFDPDCLFLSPRFPLPLTH